ncbi:histidine ammonia-lyase [Priestia megaterium]|uniref:histidine ammonia-lyase n=2 Tax=Priestia megaterium TaxID=1404 RepID=UPI00300B48B1
MIEVRETKVVIEDNLTIKDLVAVARHHASLELSEKRKKCIIQARKLVERFVEENQVIYGITTGVGENSKVRISTTESKEMQKKLIMSHACGVGEPLKPEQVRAIMVMMIQNFSQGYSGIRLETVKALIKLLNKGVTPIVPKEGSLGYLNHQAHISLVLLGMGEAKYKGIVMSGKEALQSIGISELELHEKEGLSLINGTVDMTGIGALAIYDAMNLLKSADIISMMSFEALRGTYYAFDPRISQVKLHPGQQKTTSNIHKIINGSKIAETFKEYRTQDALSIRSIPQVHGACKDAMNYAKEVVEREMNSATDNPLIFHEGEKGVAISSSNCHGEAVALAMDFLTIAISELANISERRVFRLLSPQHSELPPFLVEKSGVNSGYMISQYVAAALVSDNKVYSHPSSVDSIPTTAGQEDHVSMGTSAALKALKVISNTEKVLGIELMCSAQGLDFLKPLESGMGTESAYQLLRQYVSPLEDDRVISEDINQSENLVHTGALVKQVEIHIGELQV